MILLALLVVAVVVAETALIARFGGRPDDGIGADLPRLEESDREKIARALRAGMPGTRGQEERW